MTEFEKILKYQDLNIALRRFDKEYEKLDDKKKLDSAKHKYNELQNIVNRGEDEAQTLISDVNAAYDEYKSLISAFDKLSESMEKAETDEEKIKFLPQLESIKSRLENVDRKIGSKLKRSKEIVSECAHAQDRKKQVRATYDDIKKRLDEYRIKKAPERKSLVDQMEKLAPEIDVALFEKYNKIRSEGILPVLVKAVGENNNYSCYCGLNLSQAKIGELSEKKLCQCESCRRMVFIDKE